MLDGARISDEPREMTAEKSDVVLHRAVQRIHEADRPYDWVGIYLLSGDREGRSVNLE
jgi:putative methionine-R-sulfoxide reductase with GAF domain